MTALNTDYRSFQAPAIDKFKDLCLKSNVPRYWAPCGPHLWHSSDQYHSQVIHHSSSVCPIWRAFIYSCWCVISSCIHASELCCNLRWGTDFNSITATENLKAGWRNATDGQQLTFGWLKHKRLQRYGHCFVTEICIAERRLARLTNATQPTLNKTMKMFVVQRKRINIIYFFRNTLPGKFGERFCLFKLEMLA
jgi:hypothetical protein